MTDKCEDTDNNGTGNEAEQMQEAYIERQERWQKTGITSAGGAGQTATPGNEEAGAPIPDKGDQHTPGR
ncbi:MAG: hypothetical protein AB1511_07440 [Deinococcota bacterium]